MRKNLAVLFLLSLRFYAQKIELTEPIKFDEDDLFDKVVSVDEKFIYELRFNTKGKGKNYFLTLFDKNTFTRAKTVPLGVYMTETDRRMMMIRAGGMAKVILHSFIVNDKYYVFSQQYLEEEKNLKYLMDVYNISSGEHTIKDKYLYQTYSDVIGMYKERLFVNPNYNKTKVLITFWGHETNARLIDLSNMNEIWNKNLPNTINDKSINPVSFEIDDKDNLYFTFETSVDFVEGTTNGAGIAVLPSESEKEKVIISDLAEIHSSGQLLFYSHNENSIHCVYKFNDKNKHPGLQYCKINTNNQTVEILKTSKYNNKALTSLVCTGDLQPHLSYNYSHFTFKQLGGFCYLYNSAEMYYSVDGVRYYSSVGIQVIKINGAGAIEWQTVIPQNSAFKRESNNHYNDLTNYTCLTNNGKLNFIYIDHPKNMDLIPDVNNFDVCKVRPISTLPNTNVISIMVDNNGTLIRKILYHNEDICILPNNINLNHNGNTVFRYLKGKKEGFAVFK